MRFESTTGGRAQRLLLAVLAAALTGIGAPAASAQSEAPPQNVAPPQISGTTIEGQTLTTTTGNWTSASPITYGYQWLRCSGPGPAACIDIPGADASDDSDYQLTAEDVDRTIRVRVTATNSGGSSSATSDPTARIEAAPPTASFTVSPQSPETGQEVTLTSDSKPPQGRSIFSYEWDLDGDDVYDDASGPQVKIIAPAPGTYEYKLRITDDRRLTSVAKRAVVVRARNRPPVAAFTFSPGNPIVGKAVQFTSTATDPDSAIASLTWDFDADGQFDDARGATVSRIFTVAGSYVVALRAVDANGAASIAFRTVNVGAGPQALRLISPFPIVRIAGIVTRTGARIRVLSVTAPPGSRVEVRCRGRGCPRGRRAVTVGASGSVRVRSLARRLRAGTRVSVRVSRPGQVGKYTLVRIRRGRPPTRKDRCLAPGASKPSPCPTG